MENKLKVRVCPVTLSNFGFVNLYTALSFSSFMYIAGVKHIPCREIHCYDQHPISYARNLAVKEFLADKNNTHLFFVDSDVVTPVNVIPRLLDHNKMVISGWYILRGNQQPSVFKQVKHGWEHVSQESLTKNKDKGLITVDGTGAGCLMIKREVFDVIDEPYFLETKDGKGVGEDLYFANNCKKHNIPIHLDPSLICRHFHFGLL